MRTTGAAIGSRIRGRGCLHLLAAALLAVALFAAAIPSVPLLAAPIATSAAQPSAAQPTAAPTPAAAVTYPDALVIQHTSASAIVIESGRGRTLYAKDARARLDLPAASKIMTALLAVEKQALDAKVTISNAVADAAYFEVTGDNVRLRTGDKYSLEYLVLRMLFYDSSAAALAVAESVGNDEAEFVRQMNARATALGLKATVFVSASGRLPAPDAQAPAPSATASPAPGQRASPAPGSNTAAATPYTSVADLATLMQRALQNERFSRLFRKQSEYLVIDGSTLVAMSNQISQLWPYSEGRVNGAYLSGQDAAVTITTGNVNGFGIVTITANGQHDRAVDDTLALLDACQRTYENFTLVRAGDPYTGAQETTRDGEPFGLVYQQTIQYVRPIGDPYLKQTTVYKSYGPYSRPIQSSMTVGQVVFELQDGTLIPVNVAPDRQILSSISLVDRMLNVLQANRNLYFLLIGSLLLLLVLLIGQLVIHIIRYSDRRRS